MKGTRIFLERVNFGRFINMHMGVQNGANDWSVAQPVIFEVTDESAANTPPMLKFTPDQAQSLIDELWTIGFRPTLGQQSEGQMGATTRHLNDMRAMVASLAKVHLP